MKKLTKKSGSKFIAYSVLKSACSCRNACGCSAACGGAYNSMGYPMYNSLSTCIQIDYMNVHFASNQKLIW